MFTKIELYNYSFNPNSITKLHTPGHTIFIEYSFTSGRWNDDHYSDQKVPSDFIVFLRNRPPGDLPSGKIPDGIFLQAGLAVFAFRGFRTLKQKHRCAFQVLSRAKQFARLGIKI